ncbi:hypothetical protein AOLI_G00303640 [Acnodon oligacanthus]
MGAQEGEKLYNFDFISELFQTTLTYILAWPESLGIIEYCSLSKKKRRKKTKIVNVHVENAFPKLCCVISLPSSPYVATSLHLPQSDSLVQKEIQSAEDKEKSSRIMRSGERVA